MHEPVFSYLPGVSPLHKLDPRTKIVAVMLLEILAFRIENFVGIVALFMFFFALTFLARLPIMVFFRVIRPTMLFIIFIFLAQLFFTDGRALASFRIMKASFEGLENGIKLVSRFLLLLLFVAFLTASTDPSVVTCGVRNNIQACTAQLAGNKFLRARYNDEYFYSHLPYYL